MKCPHCGKEVELSLTRLRLTGKLRVGGEVLGKEGKKFYRLHRVRREREKETEKEG
jgi:hypothetical protein